ncbi:uncharacterized protein LOC112906411 [Agrilus planipennis]|uniref:Uncharacterized protein LOC112906411 n=1 Tax=Agrilus planipennis TaxID=224129 RepID=A0A7F5RK68_AGRPL|nr:uncharacterized protein LOC112906411 [Agrilus planipennis]
MSTIADMLRIECRINTSNWADKLCKIQLVLNTTYQKSTEYTPLQLLIGRESSVPAVAAILNDLATKEISPNKRIAREKAAQSLKKNAAYQEERSSKAVMPQFKAGDLVVILRSANERHKLSSPCKGPYEVVGEKSPGKYVLKGVSDLLRNTTTIASAEHLKKWTTEWFPELCEALINDDNDVGNGSEKTLR